MFDFIAKPFGMLLMLLYQLVSNYGIAIILFALLVRLVLTPFLMKSKRGMMRMTRLQPKVKELEKKHGANKQKYQAEVAKLYKDENVNPASGCLWGLLPLPIMIALYSAVNQPLTIMMGVASDLLAEGGALLNRLTETGFDPTGISNLQIAQTEHISAHFDKFAGITDKLQHIDFRFLGINLGDTPQWNFLWTTDWGDPNKWVQGLILFMIPILSGVFQFISSRLMNKLNAAPKAEGQGNSMQMMLLMMPLLSVYFGFAFPAALGLYWIAGTVFYTIQDVILTKRIGKIIDAEEIVKDAERKRREEELEAKRIETERKKAENNTERNPNTSKRKRQATEREEYRTRAAEFNKKDAPPTRDEPSREGNRRYARGRAYDPDRFGTNGYADAWNDETAELPETTAEGISDEADDGIRMPDIADVEVPDVDDFGSEADDEDWDDEADLDDLSEESDDE